jgi:hypothetical protein
MKHSLAKVSFKTMRISWYTNVKIICIGGKLLKKEFMSELKAYTNFIPILLLKI